MRNRTKMIAAATVVTAALAGGGTTAALATTASAAPGGPAMTGQAATGQAAAVAALAKPGTATTVPPVNRNCVSGTEAAARLGVSADRLNQALRATKTSFRGAGQITETQFDTAVARNLGVSLPQVRQALQSGQSNCVKFPGPGTKGGPGSKGGGVSKGGPGSKPAPSAADVRRTQSAMTAVVARELHVAAARVTAALRPVFAAGHADTESAAFATAARSLGVSTQQLAAALMHAKQSQAAAPPKQTASGQTAGVK